MEGRDAVVYKSVVLSLSLPFILLDLQNVIGLFRLPETLLGKVKACLRTLTVMRATIMGAFVNLSVILDNHKQLQGCLAIFGFLVLAFLQLCFRASQYFAKVNFF